MDISYWNDFYKKAEVPLEPTSFAKDSLVYLEEGKKLGELGCGNGRDSLLMVRHGLSVVAIDQSESMISKLQQEYKNEQHIEFIQADFVHSDVLKEKSFDYIYSRFTLHSITEEEEDILLDKVFRALKPNGRFFIEARSTKDRICGLGEKVGRNAYYYHNHYRRFIELEELISKLKELGFEVLLKLEGDNLAKFKDEDPIVIRIIVEKTKADN